MAQESDKKNKYTPPEAGKRDVVHTIARAGISSIPVIGGAGVELFNYVISPPLERRRQEWMELVGQALRQLEEEKGIALESLQQNDIFIDTVFRASQIAMRTSQGEKKEALRNAILNSALQHSPDESLQQLFLNIVDIFTVWHIRLMKLFQDPQEWANKNNHKFPSFYSAGLSRILESAFPELSGRRAFYDQLWQDVNNYGLTRTPSLHGMMTEQGLMAKRLSELGEEFMRFIESPI